MEQESVEYILGQISGELISIRSHQIQMNERITEAFKVMENNVIKSEHCRRMVIEHETKLHDLREDVSRKNTWKSSVIGGLIVGIPSWIAIFITFYKGIA
jgi:lipid-A-disaccharide synthase-like uncharacterized protein